MKAEHQHHLHQRVVAQNNRTSLAGGSANSSTNTSNQPFSNNGLASRIDLFIQSESPLEQEIHLHQKLREQIKNSNGRRYGSSELYLAKTRSSSNQNHHQYHERSLLASSCSGPSEVQSTTLNIGVRRNSASSNNLSGESTNLTKKPSSNIKSTQQQNASIKEHQQNVDSSTTNSDSTLTNEQKQMAMNNTNSSSSSSIPCRVCLIKEVRRDLVNINKMVQESNEEISKMKAKCLRSYFERQMKD